MKKGFSLVELLVVVAVSIVLASLIMVSLTLARTRNRDSQRIADLNSISQAMQAYYYDHSAYPTETTMPTILKRLDDDGYLDKSPIDAKDGEIVYCTSSLTAAEIKNNQVGKGNFLIGKAFASALPYTTYGYEFINKTTSNNITEKGYYLYTVLENKKNATGTIGCDASWGAGAYILKDGMAYYGLVQL